MTTNIGGLTHTDLQEMLRRGAALTGNAATAAVHLITATRVNLLYALNCGAIEVIERPDVHTHEPVYCAYVKKWRDLRQDDLRGLPASDLALLRMAESYMRYSLNTGDLAEWTENLTDVHAQVAAESILIASGFHAWFEVARTADGYRAGHGSRA